MFIVLGGYYVVHSMHLHLGLNLGRVCGFPHPHQILSSVLTSHREYIHREHIRLRQVRSIGVNILWQKMRWQKVVRVVIDIHMLSVEIATCS